MPPSVSRYYDPNAEAKLLLGFLAVALVAGTGYICYSRLHVRKEQLMEASLYILAWSFVFWDVLRYVLTAPVEKENAWPHPPLRISRKLDNQALSLSATTFTASRWSGRMTCGSCRPTASV